MKRTAGYLAAAALVFLTSLALGIFLFDHRLIVFKKVFPDKVTLYSNFTGVETCFWYALAFLPLIGLSVVWLGLRLARVRGIELARGLVIQAMSLTPALALVFARLFDGKYLKFIFYLPLFPIFIAAVLGSILALNARFHLGVGALKLGRAKSSPPGAGHSPAKRTALVLAPLALLFVHLLSVSPFFRRFSSLMIFTGDEPKYLRMAYSLASDGDLDLTDDFVGDEVEVQWRLQRAKDAGEKAIGHFSIVGRDGGIYHFHMPGLSVLMQPGFLLDLAVFQREIPNTQAIMFLPAKMIFTRAWLLALALCFFFLSARFFHLMFRSPFILALLLLAMMFGTKVPDFMFQVYPDAAAGLFLMLGLNAVFFPFRKSGWNALGLAAAIGALPWLHQRFIPLAAGLYVVFLLQRIRSGRRGREILAVSLALAGAGFGYLAYFQAITGSPLPWSMYSLWGTSYTRAAILPSGFFGYIFDTGSGLLSLFPLFLFALAGFYWGVRLDRRRALTLLAFILPYFLLISITPWHGLDWETTRMSLVLFPVFLVFGGYTLQALARRTSWAHLALYLGALAFIGWNRGHRLWEIRLGNVLVLPHQVGYIVQCFFVLVGFYTVLRMLELWTDKKLGRLPVDKFGRALRMAGSGLWSVFRSPKVWKPLLGTGLVMCLAFIPVFLRNWDDRTMAKSYFDALNKIGRREGVVLRQKGYPSSGRSRYDPNFADVFKWTLPVELKPGAGRASVRLGQGFFAEICPPGCYKVDLELIDVPPQLDRVSLDFMRETREMPLLPLDGKSIVSTIYLAFEDMAVSPYFTVRYSARLDAPVRGRFVFFPIPSVVFDKILMIRLNEGLFPDPIRRTGSHSYLGLVANSRKDNSSYIFELALEPQILKEGRPKTGPRLLQPVRFRNRGRHRFDVGLDRLSGGPGAGEALAFFVSDAGGRGLAARSLWLAVRGGAWLIPLRP